MDAIDKQQYVSPVALRKFFWDMFIADALLGNFDRHNGNWVFFMMTTKRKLKLLLSLTAEAACYRKLMKKSCGKYSQAKLNYMQGFFNFQILPSSLTVAKSTITIF